MGVRMKKALWCCHPTPPPTKLCMQHIVSCERWGRSWCSPGAVASGGEGFCHSDVGRTVGLGVQALGLVGPLVWMAGAWAIHFCRGGGKLPLIAWYWCLLRCRSSLAVLCCSALAMGLWLSMDWLALTPVLTGRGHWGLCLSVLLGA